MTPFKALGPDGIPAGFYQKMWHIAENSICEFAFQFFSSGELSRGINETLLTLIPKVSNPELVAQFMSISLCNVSYNILTKTMTNRLKHVMADLVEPFQISFVPGCQISDTYSISTGAPLNEEKKPMCKVIWQSKLI